MNPHIENIYITAVESAVPDPVATAELEAGKGIRGDWNYWAGGWNESGPESGHELTLIEAEAIEAMKREQGIEILPAESRRNILTRNVALNHLVGRRFRVGGVLCEGIRLCEPCSHLEKLTKPGVMKCLLHRGGLRANILEGGQVRVGDRIVAVE